MGIPLIQTFTCLIPQSMYSMQNAENEVRVQDGYRSLQALPQWWPRMCHIKTQKASYATVRFSIRFLMVIIPYLRTRKREHLLQQIRAQAAQIQKLMAQHDTPNNEDSASEREQNPAPSSSVPPPSESLHEKLQSLLVTLTEVWFSRISMHCN